LGIGALPDSESYGDLNVNTLAHIADSVDTFKIPNLQKLGLGNLCPMKQVLPVEKPMGSYAKLAETSIGKDTMTGHWEMMGLHITQPFQTFTDTGFPKELIDELEKRTGHKVIGNKRNRNWEYDRLHLSRFRAANLRERRNLRAG
jgi:phosphopentomutase